jgi:hypothetical protein
MFSEKDMLLTLMLKFPKFIMLLTISLICLRAEPIILKHNLASNKL